jgi:hypothetical protein
MRRALKRRSCGAMTRSLHERVVTPSAHECEDALLSAFSSLTPPLV